VFDHRCQGSVVGGREVEANVAQDETVRVRCCAHEFKQLRELLPIRNRNRPQSVGIVDELQGAGDVNESERRSVRIQRDGGFTRGDSVAATHTRTAFVCTFCEGRFENEVPGTACKLSENELVACRPPTRHEQKRQPQHDDTVSN
jgi:hypothetical protein